MISCTEFIPLYSELFKFIDSKEGKEGVTKYWEYISDTYVEDLLGKCVKEEGLHGCWTYWSKSLNEEACDFKMILDEESNEFAIYMGGCPSKAMINKLSYMNPYEDYCGHCAILYDRVLRKYGIEMFEKDYSKISESKCILRFCKQFKDYEKIKLENLNRIVKNNQVVEFVNKLCKNTPVGAYEFGDKYVVKVVEYKTKEEESKDFELHKEHFDIHLMISGEEKILFSNKKVESIKDFDDINDGGIVEVPKTSAINYSEKEAIIIPPNILHMAGYSVDSEKTIKKAIIKIKK